MSAPILRCAACEHAENGHADGANSSFPAPTARAGRVTLVRVRLLLVEDEPRLGRALVRGLTAEGFVVDLATDGRDGLDHALHGGYDAVVLDVMLPVMS